MPPITPLATVEPLVDIVNEVAEALSNALENGHDFKGWTDDAILDDMYECGGLDVNNEHPREEVLVAIRALRT